jgi:GDP-4-dehydro-6-deoxy-D-mannose reductase
MRVALPAARLVGASRTGAPVSGLDEARAFDLRDGEAVEALLAELRPQACVHLAAVAAVGSSFADPDTAWGVNVDGTRALAGAILRHVPDCHLLHVSSAEVYGLSFRSKAALDEAAPMLPANPYAASKAAADLALGEMALRGLRVLRLRPANQIGPGQSTRFALPAFARQIALIAAGGQENVIRTGALDRWRDFLDVRDVCDAYVAALCRADELEPGLAFNVASGRLRRIGDALNDLVRLAGVEVSIRAGTAELRPIDLPETRCSAERARQALDWAPRRHWEATLRDVLDYWHAVIAGDADPPAETG